VTRFCYSALVGCAWLFLLYFLPSSLSLSFAEEPVAPSPDRDQTTIPNSGHAEAATQSDEPALIEGDEESVRRRRFLKELGPQPLTPEEQEEAERLSKTAAKMGIDPTAIIGRVQTLYRRDALSAGARTDNLVGRIDIPYHREFLLRADVPYVWSDPNQPGATNQNGLSDLFVRTGARVYSVPGFAFFAGADVTFPTADDRQLGSGKYTLGPGLATARVLPDIDSILFALLEHQVSVGGDPSRQNISKSLMGFVFNTIWGERWWTQVQATTQLDWERNAKNSMTLEFEGGHEFTRNWGVWVRPGVGLWGQAVPGAYEWNIEAGIRRTFPSF
jgi:hypothetical protein